MNVRRFVVYAAVGAVGTAVQYVALVALVTLAQVSAPVASCFGALLGAVINYTLNHRVTFRSTRSHREAASRYVTIAACALVLNWLAMTMLVQECGVQYLVAQCLTTAVLMLFTYVANAAWSFRSEPEVL